MDFMIRFLHTEMSGSEPSWNFHKHLINQDGMLVSTFATGTDAGKVEATIALAMRKVLEEKEL